MTAGDRPRFARCYAALSLAFDRYQLSEDRQALRAEVYFESLIGFEIEEVERAVRRVIDVGRGFPYPVDIRDEIWRAKRAAQPGYIALPVHEPTEDEITEVKARLAELYLRLGRMTEGVRSRRPVEVWEPTSEELAEHQRRQELAREQLRQVQARDGQAPA